MLWSVALLLPESCVVVFVEVVLVVVVDVAVRST